MPDTFYGFNLASMRRLITDAITTFETNCGNVSLDRVRYGPIFQYNGRQDLKKREFLRIDLPTYFIPEYSDESDVIRMQSLNANWSRSKIAMPKVPSVIVVQRLVCSKCLMAT